MYEIRINNNPINKINNFITSILIYLMINRTYYYRYLFYLFSVNNKIIKTFISLFLILAKHVKTLEI